MVDIRNRLLLLFSSAGGLRGSGLPAAVRVVYAPALLSGHLLRTYGRGATQISGGAVEAVVARHVGARLAEAAVASVAAQTDLATQQAANKRVSVGGAVWLERLILVEAGETRAHRRPAAAAGRRARRRRVAARRQARHASQRADRVARFLQHTNAHAACMHAVRNTRHTQKTQIPLTF